MATTKAKESKVSAVKSVSDVDAQVGKFSFAKGRIALTQAVVNLAYALVDTSDFRDAKIAMQKEALQRALDATKEANQVKAKLGTREVDLDFLADVAAWAANAYVPKPKEAEAYIATNKAKLESALKVVRDAKAEVSKLGCTLDLATLTVKASESDLPSFLVVGGNRKGGNVGKSRSAKTYEGVFHGQPFASLSKLGEVVESLGGKAKTKYGKVNLQNATALGYHADDWLKVTCFHGKSQAWKEGSMADAVRNEDGTFKLKVTVTEA